MPSGPQPPVSQFGDFWCPNSKRLDVAILLLVGFPRLPSLVIYLVDWLFTLVSWLILMVWFLVIDWSSCQRSAALWTSRNRYFPFAHGPLNLSSPGPKSVTPVWPTCPLRRASNRGSAQCYHPAGSRDACHVPLRCRDVALFLPVQSSRQSPKSVIPFCTRHCPPFSSPWSPNSLILHPLLAAPLLREFAAYLVSGRPSVAADAKIIINGLEMYDLISRPAPWVLGMWLLRRSGNDSSG